MTRIRERAMHVIAAAVPVAKPLALSSIAGPLGLVERLIVLRERAPFVGARLRGRAPAQDHGN